MKTVAHGAQICLALSMLQPMGPDMFQFTSPWPVYLDRRGLESLRRGCKACRGCQTLLVS